MFFPLHFRYPRVFTGGWVGRVNREQAYSQPPSSLSSHLLPGRWVLLLCPFFSIHHLHSLQSLDACQCYGIYTLSFVTPYSATLWATAVDWMLIFSLLPQAGTHMFSDLVFSWVKMHTQWGSCICCWLTAPSLAYEMMWIWPDLYFIQHVIVAAHRLSSSWMSCVTLSSDKIVWWKVRFFFPTLKGKNKHSIKPKRNWARRALLLTETKSSLKDPLINRCMSWGIKWVICLDIAWWGWIFEGPQGLGLVQKTQTRHLQFSSTNKTVSQNTDFIPVAPEAKSNNSVSNYKKIDESLYEKENSDSPGDLEVKWSALGFHQLSHLFKKFHMAAPPGDRCGGVGDPPGWMCGPALKWRVPSTF